MSSVEIGSREIASILADVPRRNILDLGTDWSTCWDRLNSPISERLRRKIVNLSFGIALALVAIASIYDAYLVFKYRMCITEENAICRWLISLEPENVSIFMCAKLTSTFFVVLLSALLFKFWRRAGILNSISLLGFQIGLMFYLHLSGA